MEMESCITRNVDLNTEKLSAGSANVIVVIFISESKNSSNRQQSLKGKDLQMPDKSNALAELAEDLRVMGVDGNEYEILDKAQRIIEELSKIRMTSPMCLTSCESEGQHEKQHGNTVSDNRRDPSQERICRIAEVMFDASEVAARERRVSDCPKAGVQSDDIATASQGA